MSLDIVFQPCRFSGFFVERKNPFTGEGQSVQPNEPLNAAEWKAVRKVLRQAKARGPDDYGCQIIECDDGGMAEVFARCLYEHVFVPGCEQE